MAASAAYLRCEKVVDRVSLARFDGMDEYLSQLQPARKAEHDD
jgi:hypothetical protein